MKKNNLLLIALLISSIIIIIFAIKRQKQQPKRGNHHITSFSKAKKIASNIYKYNQYTFYCNCPYTRNKINYKHCNYNPIDKESTRASRVEWEHIVPASFFGKSFSSWKNGHRKCKTKKNKPYKGRKCARLISSEFRRMEADLYNLVPVIGELNARRSNYPMGLFEINQLSMKNECQTFVNNKLITPRKEIRGFIARTYKYMNDSYPRRNILSEKNKVLFDTWDQSYPPNKMERRRNKKIARIQGNKNHYAVK